MESVNISEFRANLLNYLKKVKEGHEIHVTSHGEVLATLVPPIDKNREAKAKLRSLAKQAVIHEITSPIDEQWDAQL